MKLLFNEDICKSKKILVNIDGIVCDHVTYVCEWANKTFDLKSEPANVNTLEYDFGPVTFEEASETCFRSDDSVLSMGQYTGFKDFFDTLSEMLVVTFTSTRKYGQDATRQWIQKHFGNCEVLFTDRKSELEFNYIIDDDPETILKSAAQKKISFLMSRPYNNNINTKKLIDSTKFAYFVQSYKDVVSFLWSTNLFQSC
jgi:hypothetical protein